MIAKYELKAKWIYDSDIDSSINEFKISFFWNEILVVKNKRTTRYLVEYFTAYQVDDIYYIAFCDFITQIKEQEYNNFLTIYYENTIYRSL